MWNKEKMCKSAAAAFLLLMSSKTTLAAKDEATEKCYGVAKMGKNDCATAKASCVSSAVKDKQGDAFLFMPKGLCNKIVGGSLQPIKGRD